MLGEPSAEFAAIFARLREILQRYAGELTVTVDTATRYCLEGGEHPVHKKPMPLAWVEIGKGYVSFHHMGVAGAPGLDGGVSPELKGRMQGKSCFHFKVRDEALFKELEGVTAAGFAALRLGGYLR